MPEIPAEHPPRTGAIAGCNFVLVPDTDDPRPRTLSYEIALAMARVHVVGLAVQSGHDLQLNFNHIVQKEYGWVFFYNTKAYLESGDSRQGLVGNAPLLVDRKTGKLHVLGTVHPLNRYLECYQGKGEAGLLKLLRSP